MSSSNSNLPVIILVVIAILALGGFYYADRSSSGTDVASITDTADTEGMIKSKKDYEAHKSAFSHAGFSGSMDDYLKHVKSGNKPSKSVQEHSGYSGSGDDYIEKHQHEETSAQMSNANHHQGFSGSMKDYAAGKFDKRPAASSNTHHEEKKDSAGKKSSSAKSSNTSTKSHSGYSGSVDSYLDKY